MQVFQHSMKIAPHETCVLQKAKFSQWKIDLHLKNLSFYKSKSPLLKPKAFFHQLSITPMTYEALVKNSRFYYELCACC